MGSYSIPLSGLLASQEALGVISNNLANLTTTGFKGSTANFSDLVYEQLGSSGSGDPIQTGLGTQIGSTSINFTQGSIDNTGVDTDVAIQGNGFLQLQNQGLTVYSRNGTLSINSQGYLVGADGSEVMGYAAANGVVNASGTTVPLQISPGETSPAQATANVTLDLNLDASSSADTTFSVPVSVYDSLGNSHVLTFTFTNNGGNSWAYAITIPAADVTATPQPTTPVSLASGTLTFDSNGNLIGPTDKAGNLENIDGITLPSGTTMADGASALTFNWDLLNAANAPVITQVAGTSAASSTEQDGFPAGTLQSFSIEQNGTIQGSFSNGQVSSLGQIVLATFSNQDGLLQTGNGNFVSTLASGLPTVGVPGTGGLGTLQGGALEGSNVDISTEFSNLILAQQDYEADARAFNIESTIFSQSTLNLGIPQ
jgi:flagellar hook protein FlgE